MRVLFPPSSSESEKIDDGDMSEKEKEMRFFGYKKPFNPGPSGLLFP
jgi:hypothetical protein